MDKFTAIITNGLTLLAKKIDSLVQEVKNQKPPIIKMDAPIIKVDLKDIKIPEFPKMPEYPAFPQIPTPVVNVEAPVVNVPAPVVNVEAPIVNVPPANITVEPTPVTFPEIMKVEGMKDLIDGINREPEPYPILLEGISNKNHIPVQVVDAKGRPLGANDFGGGSGGPSTVAIRVGTQAVGSDNLLPVTTDGFSIPVFDTQVIDESAAPATTTITYK